MLKKANKDIWKCPKCGTVNTMTGVFCLNCGHKNDVSNKNNFSTTKDKQQINNSKKSSNISKESSKPKTDTKNTWTCNSCGFVNKTKYGNFCLNCGIKKGTSPNPLETKKENNKNTNTYKKTNSTNISHTNNIKAKSVEASNNNIKAESADASNNNIKAESADASINTQKKTDTKKKKSYTEEKNTSIDASILKEDENVNTAKQNLKEEIVSKNISSKPTVKNYSEDDIKNKIKEISVSPLMESILQPLASQNVRGFRCCFLGNSGTKKDESCALLAKLLYKIGKINTPECTRISFEDIPDKFNNNELYVIDDLSSAITNLFNLDDISQNSTKMQNEYKILLDRLLAAGKSNYIILDTNSAELKGFMPLDARIRYIFTKQIQFPDLCDEDIYNKFLSFLPIFHRGLVNEEFHKKFLLYLKRNKRYFPFNNTELAEFLANDTALKPTLSLPAEKYNSNTLRESFSNIIGMNVVKDQVNELNEYLIARGRLQSLGAKLPPFNLHMMFLGNPGVGKTTIARIIAKLLFDLGYIREEKLIEVSSKDLVGAYSNQTGLKTNRVIMNALGGVLFVDEAYSLSQSCGQSGLEAIATLVKAMEDYKSDLVCMFAGYSKEMDDFVRSNSGIASRINYIFEFADYTAEELYQIFELKLHNAGLTISESAVEPLKSVIKFGAGRRNFGNGRYVDKLLQRTLTKHALLNLQGSDLLVLRKESVPSVDEIMKSFGRFSA